MTAVRIEKFDPQTATTEQWAAWHIYRRQRHTDDALDDPWRSDTTIESDMKLPHPLARQQYWLAWDGAQIVASSEASVRRDGTEHYETYAPYIDAWIGVLKTHQRQGIGRCLLQMIAGQMIAENRTILSINARTEAGNAFLAAAGMDAKQRRIKNRLNLTDADRPKWMQWQAAVTKIVPPLQWEVHVNRVPLQRWEQLCAPLSTLNNQQPFDDMDVPSMNFEMAAIRDWHDYLDRTGGRHFMVLLKTSNNADATIVAMTNGEWSAHQTDRVQQYLTGVATEWRGKGLGKAVKARFLNLLREHCPQATAVETFNAASNGPMLAINRQIGFTPVRETATYQITRDRLVAGAIEGATP